MSDDLAKLFDVAKKVGEELNKLPKNEQAKVLRWVAESLGASLPGAAAASAPMHGAAPRVALTTTPTTEATPPATGGRPKDIKTFLAEKQPKSDNQYAASVAYYYRFEAPEQERSETIAADTLQEAARLSGRARLGNPRSTLNNAVAQGYLDRKDRGQFGISTVGENLVAMTLPGGADAPQPVKKKRAANKKKAGKKIASKKTRRRKK